MIASIISLLKAVRVQNLFILALSQYFSALFLIDKWQNPALILGDFQLHLIVLSTGFVAAAGYIINDYYDIKIDYINRPNQVVIGKKISRRIAMTLHTSFSFIGITIGAFVSLKIGAINLVCAFLLWLYSNLLKRQPLVGNAIIALLSAASILVIAVLYNQGWGLIGLYAFFAGSFSLIREVIKDIEDIDGDRKFGCRTLPIVWGVRRTKILLQVLLVAFNLTFIYVAEQYLGSYWLIMSSVLFLFSLALFIKLRFADKRKDYTSLSDWCKWVLLLGIISMAFIN